MELSHTDATSQNVKDHSPLKATWWTISESIQMKSHIFAISAIKNFFEKVICYTTKKRKAANHRKSWKFMLVNFAEKLLNRFQRS